MTAITNAFRPMFSGSCSRPKSRATAGATREYQVLFGAALAFLAGGAAIVLHGLGGVVAFH